MPVNSVIKKLGNYNLEIINIIDFKDFFYDNLSSFTGISSNAFLKALDIPPKFFKEQPEETQKELLENRDTFVRENKKFFDKVIVLLRDPVSDQILNACRLSDKEAEEKYEKLKPIDDIDNRFEHRTFIKDGYASIVIGDIKDKQENQVLVVDFPMLMNKKVIIHRAYFTPPSQDAKVPVDHINYLTNDEIDLDGTYTDIADALEDYLPFLTENREKVADLNILKDIDLITIALVESNTIPKNYRDKVGKYIASNVVDGGLTTNSLENLVLDFDETVKGYKQVTNLRNVSGQEVLNLIESDEFKELIEQMNEEAEA